jgi:CHAT domain-containing protein/Flp pilus assembly protein TadD
MKIKNDRCLDDQDFYNFIAGKGVPDPQIQAHLSSCSTCCENLAELVRMLDETSAQPTEEMHPQEINGSLADIQNVARPAPANRWLYRWGSIAAAVLMAIGLTSAGFLLYVRHKSQSYCNQAQALLQTVYQARSPNDLRLDLPFQSDVTLRANSDKNEAIDGAERLYNQALGVLDGMAQARLGLGYLDLQKNQFGKAEEQFQKLLESKPSDLQALIGRGVSRFEAGLAAADPANRNRYLEGALRDFAEALKMNSGSKEARYNKIQVLYNTGRHKEALQEIDAYLLQDSSSIWAAKLKELKIRINTNDIYRLIKEAEKAALTRDAPYLETLVRIAPEKIATSVINMYRDALAAEGLPAMQGAPDSAAIQWAAQFMAQAYQQATGDGSCIHLIKFYAGLSPPQRKLKQKLDARLEHLIKLYDKTKFQSVIDQSDFLVRDFIILQDYWQLVRTFQLRGSCRYVGENDYSASSHEFGEMLRYAELSGHSELIARSLQSLASAYAGAGQVDKESACLSKLEEMANSPQMNYLNAFIFDALGKAYSKSNQNDISLQHFLSCLALSYKLMDTRNLVSSLESIGSLMEKAGKYSEAKKYYGEYIAWLKLLLNEGLQRANSEAEWNLHLIQNRLGRLANKTKDFKSAEAIFQGMLQGRLSKRLKEFEAIDHMGLAISFQGQNKFDEADVELDKAIKLATESNYPQTAWEANYWKGLLSEKKGDKEKAFGFFTQSTGIIEKLRAAIIDPNLRQSFFSERFDPYRRNASLLYHYKNNPQGSLDYANSVKSMTLKETLNLYESQKQPASDFPCQLTSRTFLLEYFFGADELLAFLIRKDGMDSIAIPVSETDIKMLISQYLDSIADNDPVAFSRLSRKLYEILIDPILSKQPLDKIENLIIMADGPLHLLPFSSLADKNGRSLLESFAISYSSSPSLLHYCLTRHKVGNIDRGSSMLFLDGGSDLKGSGREFTNILNLYPNNKLLFDPDAIQSGVFFDPYRIIHFSGHASLKLGKPRLLFHTPAGDKYLDAESIRYWRLQNNRLVVLAGCNTGIGPVFDGETPWGLAPAFLRAGAPALLVSLFPVNDLATASFTSRFYESLAGGSSKTQALRSAQLSLLRSKSQSSPAFWAPFILIGDPR